MYQIVNIVVSWIYQTLIGQIVTAILALCGLVQIVMWIYNAYKCFKCKSAREPKIIFGEPRFGLKDGENAMSWYIRLANQRLEGWMAHNCQRDVAHECKVEAEFNIDGKLLVNTIYFEPDGITLNPDSLFAEFPIATLTKIVGGEHQQNVYLDNTSASTDTPIPPLRIPKKTQILTDIAVISPSIKKPSKSKWRIDVDIASKLVNLNLTRVN